MREGASSSLAPSLFSAMAARTRTPHRLRSGAFLHCAPRALLHLRSEHTCVSLCLSHDCGFFPRAFPQSQSRARAPPLTSPPPSSPSPRASLPRDGPILRPRAGLPLSQGPATLSPFAISFGATRRTRVPSSLRHSVGCCMSAPRLFKRPSSLQPLVVPHLHAAECTHAQPKASLLLPCSQDDGDAHQLCSGDDQLQRLLGRVGGVFPGWDEDCVGIGRRDDQSLGFGCAASSKSPLLGQN